MIRRSLVMGMVLASFTLMGHLPYEVQDKIVNLYLKNIRISYKEGGSYVAVIGINSHGKKVAYVAVRHILGDFSYKWSPFASIPFDQRNDVFAIIQQEDKMIAIQSKSDYTNSTGHHIEFDHVTQRIVIRPIEISRALLGSEVDALFFDLE